MEPNNDEFNSHNLLSTGQHYSRFKSTIAQPAATHEYA